ncbi:hypothetical protein FOMG_18832 [Fusarium oxysporum f. sp. melonis 26406]|uniref:Uncharacterized protein n=1 Tax=Fusarium oxysporum f. sp. melonis 26406 TaxID=1089452 RepID=W9Z833_FUSOX|nr:hypothetical protein FOMG_18832 [Fusarium oxysporum f. sp. melonis 26406]
MSDCPLRYPKTLIQPRLLQFHWLLIQHGLLSSLMTALHSIQTIQETKVPC